MKGLDQKRQRVAIDAELVSIIPEFFSYRGKDIDTIRLALTGEDFATIAFIGHNIKGSGGAFGFEQISVIGQQLEEAATSRDQVTISALVDSLERYLAQVEIVYV
jgi:HPt (histidine-containing phosphotransfer) domain-containing protein